MLAAPWPGWAIRRESHRVWLPPSAKRTDLLPALRTNPLPEPNSGEQTTGPVILRPLSSGITAVTGARRQHLISTFASQCKAASGLFCSSPLGSTVARAARCPLPRAAGSSKDDPELRGWLYGFKARRHHPTLRMTFSCFSLAFYPL
ncbi:hypothetical protein R6Z07F_019541 [Ovis aries]